MFYHFHLIKATIIFHPDYCNTLLTSPSFYSPLLQCIFNIATRDSFNLIQIIHSSVEDPPVTLCITRRKRPSPYNGLLIIALSATLLTPWQAPLFPTLCPPLLTLFQHPHLFVIPRTCQILYIYYFFFLECSSSQIFSWLTSSPPSGLCSNITSQWGLL